MINRLHQLIIIKHQINHFLYFTPTKGKSVEVGVTAYILSISSLSERDMVRKLCEMISISYNYYVCFINDDMWNPNNLKKMRNVWLTYVISTFRNVIIFLNQDFTLDMYFRQFWHDPRLEFERRPGLEKIVVNGEETPRFWTPDTFFVNNKEGFTHKEIKPNIFMRILHTGEVLWNRRYFEIKYVN